MEAFFSDQEIEVEVRNPESGKLELVKKVVPFFHLTKASTACRNAQAFTFDGPATERHKAEYADAWSHFVAAKDGGDATVKGSDVEAIEHKPKKARKSPKKARKSK